MFIVFRLGVLAVYKNKFTTPKNLLNYKFHDLLRSQQY